MRSLRARLLALWFLLLALAGATGFLLLEFYRQSAAVQVAQAEEVVSRSCREIVDRYAFFSTGWSGRGQAELDEDIRRALTSVVQTALSRASGVEGGIWQARLGSLAYAFPTYEGTGPKMDLPSAKLAAIRQVNAEALRYDRPITVRNPGRFQLLVLQPVLCQQSRIRPHGLWPGPTRAGALPTISCSRVSACSR